MSLLWQVSQVIGRGFSSLLSSTNAVQLALEVCAA
jgi:hypothetical protein